MKLFYLYVELPKYPEEDMSHFLATAALLSFPSDLPQFLHVLQVPFCSSRGHSYLVPVHYCAFFPK